MIQEFIVSVVSQSGIELNSSMPNSICPPALTNPRIRSVRCVQFPGTNQTGRRPIYRDTKSTTERLAVEWKNTVCQSNEEELCRACVVNLGWSTAKAKTSMNVSAMARWTLAFQLWKRDRQTNRQIDNNNMDYGPWTTDYGRTMDWMICFDSDDVF